jgi:hypothetical protein
MIANNAIQVTGTIQVWTITPCGIRRRTICVRERRRVVIPAIVMMRGLRPMVMGRNLLPKRPSSQRPARRGIKARKVAV